MSDDTVGTPVEELDLFWQAVEEAAKGTGGGYIGQVEFGFCWKVFTTAEMGFTNQATTFPYDITPDRAKNKSLMEAARAEANRFVVDNGLKKDPKNCFYIVLRKDTILNKEVSWKDDRWNYLFSNSPDYTEIIYPHLRDAFGTEFEKRFGKFWARVSWEKAKDQSRAKDKKDAEGNVILDSEGNPEKQEVLTMYVAKLYHDENEAMVDAGVADKDAPAPATAPVVPMPEGYDLGTWKTTVEEIRTNFRDKKTPIVKLASDYDLPKDTINQIVADLKK